MTIDFGLPPTVDGTSGVQWKCSYTAPVISGSNLPLLLGLKSLQAKKALLDTHGKLLIIPGPGGVEIRCSPGTVALQLAMSESGHLIMPLNPMPEATSSGDNVERMDFNVQCRSARTPSPSRSRPEVPPGELQRSRSGNVVRTGRTLMSDAEMGAVVDVVRDHAREAFARRAAADASVTPGSADPTSRTISVRSANRRDSSRSRDPLQHMSAATDPAM